MVTPTTDRQELFDAKQAIDNGEFRVRYQPQVDIVNGRLSGVEALARWRGPEGVVGPNSFLSQMERERLLAPLLQFVMNNSAREMARWIRLNPDLKVAINLSASDLENEDMLEYTEQLISSWGLQPQALKLEITEASLMRDPYRSAVTLSELRALGVSVSIDDFGVGRVSRAWLEKFAVDEFKIDMKFVGRINANEADRKFVCSIIELAHAMSVSVVAVGVENREIAEVLQRSGCNTGQGFFYSRPLSGKAFENEWLGARQPVPTDA